MTTSVPITLAHHVFPHVSISTNTTFQPSAEPIATPPIESKLTVSEIDGGKNHFVIELRVLVNAENNSRIPYSVDVVCVAQAMITGELPADESPNRVVAEIGHRILFPAVRELILSLTARQPWGQFSIGIGVIGAIKPTAEAAPERKRSRPRKAAAKAIAPPTAPTKRPALRRVTIRKKPAA